MKKFLILCLFVLGCGSTPIIVIEPLDTNDCTMACQHLRDLGCPEGSPLPDGTSCADWCTWTQENGHGLNPSCVKTIMACAAMESCLSHR